MTKSTRKNVPDVGIELGAACMPSELASDRATAPGQWNRENGRRSFSWPSLHERMCRTWGSNWSACMLTGHASDRATSPENANLLNELICHSTIIFQRANFPDLIGRLRHNASSINNRCKNFTFQDFRHHDAVGGVSYLAMLKWKFQQHVIWTSQRLRYVEMNLEEDLCR